MPRFSFCFSFSGCALPSFGSFSFLASFSISVALPPKFIMWILTRRIVSRFDGTRGGDIPTESKLSSPGDDEAAAPSFRWRYLLLNLFWLLVSAAALTMVAVYLARQDGRQADDVHTIVAWLAAVAKLALAIPLAECIGQAKWALFNNRRRLTDLDYADAASRNAFGALAWILRFRGGVVVNLGAALVVAAVAFEPAMQHLVRYHLVQVDVGGARLAVNTDYSPSRGFGRGLIFATPQVVLWGAYSAILGQAVQATASCPTGNCTIPAATSTVGICSKCTDVTDSLSRDCRDLTAASAFCVSRGTCFTTGRMCTYSHSATNATAGNGDTFLDVVASGINFENSTDGKVSISRDVLSLTAVFIQPGDEDLPDTGAVFETRFPVAPGHVSANNGRDRAKAYTCALSYCEQRLRSTIVDGALVEIRSVADDSFEQLTMDRPDLSDITDELFERGINLTRSARSARVSVAAIFALSRGLAASLTGTSAKPASPVPVPGGVSELHRAMYEKLARVPFDGVVADMAFSMTNAIRNDGDTVAGAAWTARRFCAVDWPWMALPAAVWLCTLLLLLALALAARRTHVAWLGTSQLAGTFYDMERTVRKDIDGLDAGWMDKHGMRRVGEKFKLRVAPVHGIADGRSKIEMTMMDSPA